MKKAVLLDLGGTLAEYYTREEFPTYLSRCLAAVAGCAGVPAAAIAGADLQQRVAQEDHEAADHSVRPLAERLRRIFDLQPGEAATDEALCRAYLGPIFACARVYDDSLPALRQLRRLGLRLAIVSNTPWGSPGDLWRQHVDHLGLADAVDCAVFCTDAGWRKPDRRPFERALALLDATAADSLFVGDHPRWDTGGAAACGIDSVLIARGQGAPPGAITDLTPLVRLAQGPAAPLP